MKRFKLIVVGRDNWTDRYLDRIEAAARGKIKWVSDDGAGTMTFDIRPDFRTTKPERKQILKSVKELAPKSRWEEIS